MLSDRLRDAEVALDDVARNLDADTISTGDAAELLSRVARLERRCAGVRTVLARRAVQSQRWKTAGARSDQDWLARETGVSTKAAAEVVDRSNHLARLDHIRAAMLAGDLSERQAALVVQGATADPRAEETLLEAADTQSIGGLATRVREVRRDASTRQQQEAREKRIHQRRSWTTRVDDDGTWVGTLRGPAVLGAELEARLKPFVDDAFNAARKEGRREPYEAYRFDGLLAMARAANDTGTGQVPVSRLAKIIVRCDATALGRGHTVPGEVCEIAGIGPVPVCVVDELTHGDPFWAAVLMDGADVSTVAHLGREPRAIQRTALEARDRGCAVAGCNHQQRLEIDHELDWAATGHTKVAELDLLCHHHHDLKTTRGWRLRRGVGERPIHPPGHPDHPGDPRPRPRPSGRRPRQPTGAETP